MFAEEALKLHARAKTEQHLHVSYPVDSDCADEICCHVHRQSPAYDVTHLESEWPLNSQPIETLR